MDETRMKLHTIIIQLKIRRKGVLEMTDCPAKDYKLRFYDKWIQFFEEGLDDFVGWYEKILFSIEYPFLGGFC